MTNQHPITPPPELVQQWASEWMSNKNVSRDNFMAAHAAQYGADQELEACCEWLEDVDCDDPQETAKRLRDARRPKPPSLKQQALAELKQLKGDANSMGMGFDAPIIRRALEALPDD